MSRPVPADPSKVVLFSDDFSSCGTASTIFKVPYHDELSLGPAAVLPALLPDEPALRRLDCHRFFLGRGSQGRPLLSRDARRALKRGPCRLDFVEGRCLRVVRRDDAVEVVLAERAFAHLPGAWQRVEISLIGNEIRVRVAGQAGFDLEDDRYPLGRVGLRADGTGRFTGVLV